MEYPAFTDKGDRIPDYSYVGYKASEQPLPDHNHVPAKITLYPDASISDDRERIQQAIDDVSAMELDENGFRGAVLLKSGRYRLSVTPYKKWCLKIAASGIVLRGEGMWDSGGTRLLAISPVAGSTMIVIDQGNNGVAESLRATDDGQDILDEYLPVNFQTFRVQDASDLYSVGENIAIRRDTNMDWIQAIGADQIARPVSQSSVDPDQYDYLGRPVYFQQNGSWMKRMPWQPGLRESYWRVITQIQDDVVTVDVPIPEYFSQQYGGGKVFKMDTSTLYENIGFEHFRIFTNYQLDEDGFDNRRHLSKGIALANVQNVFVRHVSSMHLYDNQVGVLSNARFVTIQDCHHSGIPKNIIESSKYGYYSGGGFPIDGQSVLIQRCTAAHVRHYGYTISGLVAGPNVILDSDGLHSEGFAETHHRWSPGVLFDRVGLQHPTSLGIWDRGWFGTGHGWTTNNSMLWNCIANKEGFSVQSPPIGRNWGVGGFIHNFESSKYNQETRYLYHQNSFVSPSSLFLQQLQDRRGKEALHHVAHDWQLASRAPSPIIEIGPPNQYSEAEVTLTGVAGFDDIRYTTDRSIPTEYSQVYDSPFMVQDGTTVRFIALGNDRTDRHSRVQGRRFKA